MGFSRKMAASLFGVVLVCFLLPFVTVSCEGRTLVELSGVDLTIGKTLEPALPEPFLVPGTLRSQRQRIHPDRRIVLAFGSAGVGLGVQCIPAPVATLIAAIAGGVGALMLLLFRSALQNEMAREGFNLVARVEYGIGYWGALVLFLAAAIYNGWLFAKKR